MSNPGEQIGAGLAGCGCLGALVLFFVGLAGGAGFGGSVLAALIILLILGYAASLVS